MGWGAHHSQQVQHHPPYSSNDMLCSQNHQSTNSAYKLPQQQQQHQQQQQSAQSTDRNTPASTPGYSTPNYSATTMLSPPLTASASQSNPYNFDWFLPAAAAAAAASSSANSKQSDKNNHKSSSAAALAPCRFNPTSNNMGSSAVAANATADYMSMFSNTNFNAEMAGLGRSNNNTTPYQQQISSPIVSSSSATTNSFPNTQGQQFSMPSSYHSLGHGLPSPTIYPPTPPPSTPSWIHPTWYNGGSGSGDTF